uniref:Uncharacterized protein n=1 Tax=Anguilla anguilla TaxID=7936 RepID=A0A0E9WIC7_ANGAN
MLACLSHTSLEINQIQATEALNILCSVLSKQNERGLKIK